MMDDDTAGDELTPDELRATGLADGATGWAEPAPSLATSPEMAAVLERLGSLEALKQRNATAQAAPSVAAAPRGLLSASGEVGDTAAGLERLWRLAGAGPTRLGAHERLAREHRPEQILEALQQEAALGVIEEDEAVPQAVEGVAPPGDPLQQLLQLQMQQTAMLAKQLQTKAVDPIQAALGGSEGSGGTTSGVEGCLRF